MRILSGRNLQRATSWTASRGLERSTGLRSATCRLCALKMAGSATWRRLPTGRTRSMDSSPRTSSSPPSRRRIGSVNSTSTCWKRSAAGCSVRWKQERHRSPSVSTSVRRTLSRKERWRRPWGFWRRTAFRSPPLCCRSRHPHPRRGCGNKGAVCLSCRGRLRAAAGLLLRKSHSLGERR